MFPRSSQESWRANRFATIRLSYRRVYSGRVRWSRLSLAGPSQPVVAVLLLAGFFDSLFSVWMNEVPPTWLDRLRGRFVVFDGPDGCGKSTQFRRFVYHAQSHGLEVCQVREPGGTAIGEQIRSVLLSPAYDPMDLRCEMLLYMASRAQLVAERIRPALDQSRLVLADRFIGSTLAYQGAAGGIPAGDILRVGEIVLGPCWPDLVVIFDVDEKTAASRLLGNTNRRRTTEVENATLFSDRMELKGIDYQRRVRQGYLEQAEAEPHRHLVINASADADTVFQRLLAALAATTPRRL